MNWPLVVLVVSILLVTISLYLKHQGDTLGILVFEAVVRRNMLTVTEEERDWCLRKIRSRWMAPIFLGMILVGLKLFFPGNNEFVGAMVDAAVPYCEDGVIDLLMHYRQEHTEE